MWKVLATGFDRFSNVKRLLLALLLGFLAVAVIANSVLIVNRQDALGRVSRYNLVWLLSQAAHEVLRLEETISASALPGNHIDADAVALRLDVLANRLVLLRTGEAAEFISERPDLKRNVEELESTLASIDKLIPGLPNPEVVVKIRNLLEPQVPRMLQLAAAANVRSGDVVAQDQHDLSFQHWLLTGLLVTAGVLIVVLLYRFASAQQRSRIDLEHEVGERTAELRKSLDYQTAISDVLEGDQPLDLRSRAGAAGGARYRDPAVPRPGRRHLPVPGRHLPLDRRLRHRRGQPGRPQGGARRGSGVGRPGRARGAAALAPSRCRTPRPR